MFEDRWCLWELLPLPQRWALLENSSFDQFPKLWVRAKSGNGNWFAILGYFLIVRNFLSTVHPTPPRIKLETQPLFGIGVRPPPPKPSGGGTYTRHQRAAEIESNDLINQGLLHVVTAVVWSRHTTLSLLALRDNSERRSAVGSWIKLISTHVPLFIWIGNMHSGQSRDQAGIIC